MRIGELAQGAGVSTDTVRLYERRGLLRSERRANGYRDYPARTDELLRLIRLAQRLGFSLAEIGTILTGLQSQHMGSEAVADLLRAKIAQIEARAADLLTLRDLLSARLVDVCPLGLD
ncbi:MAG: MerR family transcriptional regulator [Rhodobacteraceae bacterium]|nr:MerR family transcriptional regulator [Paracoccaceae bacterium]